MKTLLYGSTFAFLIFTSLISDKTSLAEVTSESSEPSQADLKKLVGTYSIARGEKSGVALPEDRLTDVTVQFTSKDITTFDRDQNQIYGAEYQIDTKTKPWKISLVASIAPQGGKGAKAEGLISFSENEVKLIYALPQGSVPTDFKTKENQQMFVLKPMEKTR